MKRKLVLFDFDGTITTKDTLLEFIKYYHGPGKWLIGFAINSPWLVLMTLKIIPNWRAKEKVLEWFFKNETEGRFNFMAKEFCHARIPQLIRPAALKAIQEYKSGGAAVVVVSASAENWVAPWCFENELDCIATRLEIIEDKITGRINGKNCYGPEKENRIKAKYEMQDFDEIVAYGDSRGDREMLALAREQHYKPFRS